MELAGCSSCGAAAHVKCVNRAGKLTNHVHAARLAALDAFQAGLDGTAARRAARRQPEPLPETEAEFVATVLDILGAPARRTRKARA